MSGIRERVAGLRKDGNRFKLSHRRVVELEVTENRNTPKVKDNLQGKERFKIWETSWPACA